ncbi:membrane-associated proteins in eicosanoid and glutathione metabolism [Suillus brevipes Sb2]|nr:membrane-associated proteins in eicosanoid and glutathione metabolism [Suillus brevipes Sb2]
MSLPEGYGYIPSSLITIGWVLVWQFYMVGKYRKKAGIEYFQLYAEKAGVKDSTAALRLNCMQRAHQNTLEQAPVVLVSTVVAGLKYPALAAAMCAAYSLTRVVYTIRYKSGKPKRVRMYGSVVSHLSILGLLFTATYVAFQLFPPC